MRKFSRRQRFVICAKKNRNVIYNGKTCNIMNVSAQCKGNYCMNFKDKSGKTVKCKMNCIPVKLCEFPARELTLIAIYGFGAEPMLLLSNLTMQEKKRLCHIVTKIYLMRWRIAEYFKFKKQQFELEDLRIMSLQSIRNLNLLATLASGYIGLTSCAHSERIYLKELKECSKRIYKVPKFIFYALGYAIERVLSMSRKSITFLFSHIFYSISVILSNLQYFLLGYYAFMFLYSLFNSVKSTKISVGSCIFHPHTVNTFANEFRYLCSFAGS